MTTTTAPPVRTTTRPGLRLALGYLTVLAIQPYLLLKLAWVSGSTFGIADVAPFKDSVLTGFNGLTLAMDLAAVLVVLALTHRLRAPAWMLLLPAWVASGLLATIVITFPLTTAIDLWSGGPGGGSGGFLEPWVRPMVYTSFVAQGLGIAAVFVLYARERWADVLTVRRSAPVAGPRRPVYAFGVAVTAVLVSFVAGLQLLWGAGFTFGVPSSTKVDVNAQIVLTTYGVLAIAGLVGLLALLRGRPGTRLWPAVVATWLGAGTMWAWGTWALLILLADTAGGADVPAMGLTMWVSLAQSVAGTIAAIVGLLLTVENRVTSPSLT